MTRVFIHPLAGVLSAYGMGLADVRALRQHAVEAVLDAAVAGRAREAVFAKLEVAARDEVAGAGHRARDDRASRATCISSTRAPTRRWKSRYDAVVARADATALPSSTDFERRYRAQYGFLMPDKPLVVEAIAVEAIGVAATPTRPLPAFAPRAGAAVAGQAPVASTPAARGTTRRCTLAQELRPGDRIAGPAIIAEPNATTVVEPGWEAQLTRARSPGPRARRRRCSARTPSAPPPTRCCSKCSTTCSWRSPSRWA